MPAQSLFCSLPVSSPRSSASACSSCCSLPASFSSAGGAHTISKPRAPEQSKKMIMILLPPLHLNEKRRQVCISNVLSLFHNKYQLALKLDLPYLPRLSLHEPIKMRLIVRQHSLVAPSQTVRGK